MNGFEVYRAYCATKLHYNTKKFSIIERGFPRTLTRTSYESRNDKFLFETFAKKFEYVQRSEIIMLFGSNFFFNKNLWIGEFNEYEELAKNRWLMMREFQRNPVGLFRSEIEKNTQDWKKFFSLECQSLMPEVINKAVSEQICPSVLVIYDHLNSGWIDAICEKAVSEHNMIMKSIGERLLKHKQLHSFTFSNLEQCSKILETLTLS